MITVQSSYSDIHKLNDAFEAAASDYDKLYASMSKTSQDALQKTWADWQDYYYGKWDEWPSNYSQIWQPVLKKAVDLMTAEIAKGAVKAEPIISAPTKPVVIEEPTYIYGRVEPKPVQPVYYDPDAIPIDYKTPEYSQLEYGESKIPWGWILGGIAGALLLSKAMK